MAQRKTSAPTSLRSWLDRQVKAAETGTNQPVAVKDFETVWSRHFKTSEITDVVIPKRTLARRKSKAEWLTPEEADRAIRLARIQLEADRVFANPEKAAQWLRAPNRKLSGQTPLTVLRSEAGAMLVGDLLGQIDHGMFA